MRLEQSIHQQLLFEQNIFRRISDRNRAYNARPKFPERRLNKIACGFELFRLAQEQDISPVQLSRNYPSLLAIYHSYCRLVPIKDAIWTNNIFGKLSTLLNVDIPKISNNHRGSDKVFYTRWAHKLLKKINEVQNTGSDIADLYFDIASIIEKNFTQEESITFFVSSALEGHKKANIWLKRNTGLQIDELSEKSQG